MKCSGASLFDDLSIALLKEVPMISILTDDSARAIIAKGRILTYHVKDEIISRNATKVETMYIVLSGDVSFVWPDKQGKLTRRICKRGALSVFGKTGFVNSSRHLPVVASSSECKIFAVSFSHYEALKEYQIRDMATVVQPVSIHHLPIMKPIPEETKDYLTNCLQCQVHDGNSTVFGKSSSQRLSHFFIVYFGHVTVCKESIYPAEASSVDEEDVKGTNVGTTTVEINQGGYFGISSLFHHNDRNERAASAHCHSRTLILTLLREDFSTLLETVSPAEYESVSYLAEKRHTHDLKRFNIPLFRGVANRQLQLLSEMCSVEDFSPNTVIFRAGDRGDKVYVIAEGTVGVYPPNEDEEAVGGMDEVVGDDKDTKGSTSPFPQPLPDGEPISKITAGSYFGELALIMDQPRAATIKALEHVVAITFVKENFDHMFQGELNARADFELRVMRHEIPLDFLLRHTRGVRSFRKHMEKEYSTEHLDFWLDVERYRSEFEYEIIQPQVDSMNDVYQQYIVDGGKNTINISGTMREKIAEAVNAVNLQQTVAPSTDLFGEVQDEILKMMASDNFQRYKKSSLFEELLQEVQAYEKGTINLPLEDIKEDHKKIVTRTNSSKSTSGNRPVYAASSRIRATKSFGTLSEQGKPAGTLSRHSSAEMYEGGDLTSVVPDREESTAV
jgi:CRP-like cAMP-binding protein